MFGTATLPANGTLAVSLRAKGLNVPIQRAYTFSGSDPGGQKWTMQLTVTFLDQQNSAAMSLSSSPDTVLRNPKGDPNCDAAHPYYQQLIFRRRTDTRSASRNSSPEGMTSAIKF